MSLAISQWVNGDVASLSADVAVDTDVINSINTTLRFRNNTPVNFNYGFSSDSSVGHLTRMKFELVTDTLDKTQRFSSSQDLGFTFQRISAN